MQNNLDTSSDTAWLLARCALGDLTPAQQTLLEDRLLHDEQLCQQLADTTELLLTLRCTPSPQTLADVDSPALSGLPRRSARARSLATAATVAAIAALSFIAVAVRSEHPEHLSDAVALSSLLQTESPDLRLSESDPWNPDNELPAPPDWLLTALDLDEQSPENSDHTFDDEEALF